MKAVHILLVEDNEGDILLTLDAFEESKIKANISIAKNGAEALDFLFKQKQFKDAQQPDLILLDINLPVFNGHDVLKQIKTNEHLKKIPAIMLTTSATPEDVSASYNGHCNSYVVKPIEMDQSIMAILKIEQFWLQLATLAH